MKSACEREQEKFIKKLSVGVVIAMISAATLAVANTIILFYMFAQHFLLAVITVASLISSIVSVILCVKWWNDALKIDGVWM